MAKLKEKQQQEEAERLAHEQELALAHDAENSFSKSIKGQKGKKNKKRGILARAAEKLDKEEKGDEENDQLLEQAIADPNYQEEIKAMTKKNKKKQV